MAATPSNGPLSGLRVLELGAFIAGPFAGQLLADLGADVVKVEPPDGGDVMRHWGIEHRGQGTWWHSIARNKRSVAVDLHEADGQRLALELVKHCDAVVENFRPGKLEEWGLGFDELSTANRKIVLTRVSGFGQFGPRSLDPGFGSIGEAIGGLRELTGVPDQPPSRSAVSIGDQVAALFVCLGTLAALRVVAQSGIGQVVDVSLYESVLAMTDSLVADFALEGVTRTRAGGALPGAAPSNGYPTSDGREIVIAANSPATFLRLAQAMGQPGLADDPRFATHQARGQRQTEVDEIVSEWTRARTVDDVSKVLRAQGVPHGLSYKASDMLSDDHFAARRSIVTVDDPHTGAQVPMTGVLPSFSATPGAIRWSGPTLGQHTREVLGEFCDVDQDRFESLCRRGVIAGE